MNNNDIYFHCMMPAEELDALLSRVRTMLKPACKIIAFPKISHTKSDTKHQTIFHHFETFCEEKITYAERMAEAYVPDEMKIQALLNSQEEAAAKREYQHKLDLLDKYMDKLGAQKEESDTPISRLHTYDYKNNTTDETQQFCEDYAKNIYSEFWDGKNSSNWKQE